MTEKSGVGQLGGWTTVNREALSALVAERDRCRAALQQIGSLTLTEGVSPLSCLAMWLAEHDGTAKIAMGDNANGWRVDLESDRGSTWGDGESLGEAILDAIDNGAAGGL